jgi:hypothetical protein
MSSGRKVVVTLTQAEAFILSRTARFIFDGIMEPTSQQDLAALKRADDKLQHQINAVRGKVST